MIEAEGLYSTLIVNCILNAFLSYTAIVLKIVTVQALRKTSSLPTPLKTLHLSLTVFDLGVGLLVQPLYVAIIWMKIKAGTENSLYHAVRMVHIIQSFLFAFASFFGVVALVVDRFLAIHFHLRYQELVTQKRVIAVVFSLWVLSAFLSIPTWKWIPKKVLFSMHATINAFCLITLSLLYFKIYAAVRRHKNQIHALRVQVAEKRDMANAARLRKTAVSTFYVYAVFLACYVSVYFLSFSSFIGGLTAVPFDMGYYVFTLMYLNSSLNPLVYSWKIRRIRQAVVGILRNNFPNF